MTQEVLTKICCKCNIEKSVSEYHILRMATDGLQYKCKTCTTEYRKERYWNNRDSELAKLTISRNKPENKMQRGKYYVANKIKYQERYKKYMSDENKKENKKIVGRQYEINNAEKIKVRRNTIEKKAQSNKSKRERHHQRKEIDMQYILKRRLRCRLRHIINYLGNKKYKLKSAIELIGCGMVEFNLHIESLFVNGMCWERISEIDIDHKTPCVKFDLTDIEEQKKCFHWSNLQPLWHIDNLKKGTK